MSISTISASVAVGEKEILNSARLQKLLVHLIDLGLQTKQAHWNIVGPYFRDLHLEFDSLAQSYQGFIDDVAERMLALGVAADGRLETVSAATTLPSFPEGRIGDLEAAGLIAERLQQIIAMARQQQEEAGESDSVTEDLYLAILAELEKQHWMLTARFAN